ncbi:hypothetical protein [Nautilia sp.]
MSRIVTIKGTQEIKNIELANEVIKELDLNNVSVQNNQFVYNWYDDYYKNEIKKAEELYKEKYKNYLKEKILENAKNQGYKLKKEITQDNKIKLVLQKRVY